MSGRRSDAALTLTDCTPLAKVAVKAAWDGAMSRALGVPLGLAARGTWQLGSDGGAVLAVGSGPGEWMVVAAPGTQPRVIEHLAQLSQGADEQVSIVDLTHGRSLVRLTGRHASDLLS